MKDSSFEAKWRKRFDEFAETQDTDASIAGWSETGLETRVRAFLRYWNARPAGERWLDLGCGAGTYARLLAEQGLDVVGADYSPRSLLKARSRSRSSIAWLSANGKRLPFASSTFDGMLCFGVTQALAETSVLAAEAARVIRPGGQLWIDALNAACLANVLSVMTRRVKGLPDHLRYERIAGLKRVLSDAGFEVIAVHWLPLAPSGWRRLSTLSDSAVVRRLFQAWPMLAAVLAHSFILRARRRGASDGASH